MFNMISDNVTYEYYNIICNKNEIILTNNSIIYCYVTKYTSQPSVVACKNQVLSFNSHTVLTSL